jgi:hypothetical protein
MADGPQDSSPSAAVTPGSEHGGSELDEGGILGRRRQAAAHNDAVIRESRRAAWLASPHRALLQYRGRPVGDEDYPRRYWLTPENPVELLCECGAADCGAKIHVTGRAYSAAREPEGGVLAAKHHVHRQLEEPAGGVLQPLLGVSPDADFQIVRPRSEWTEPLDVETLKDALEDARRRQGVLSHELNSSLTRIAAAASTGGLILGLLTAVRPSRVAELPLPWIAVGFLVLAGLIWTSLFTAAAIRSRRQKLFFTPVLNLSPQEMADFERDREKRHPFGRPVAIGATYAAVERLHRAERAGGRQLLGHLDWLVFELHRHDLEDDELVDLLRRANRAESDALFWLFLLLVYVVSVALFA